MAKAPNNTAATQIPKNAGVMANGTAQPSDNQAVIPKIASATANAIKAPPALKASDTVTSRLAELDSFEEEFFAAIDQQHSALLT
ncbi:hypothetical protein NLL29_08215 [Corynebacterium pseudodiphtheriticum]|uniref:hypothetical protein n=1 Tax=Corynebacterium pseudodiphtheriticum TaxID=37637 RepID=UPI0026700046|nr:hypothetical protein [Corynebacterium pseudodiphtheriticum]WKS29669.1 hypothetical protein NLL29_08215 [Corynebacterium pseudodiphtheriticum]WKS51084.1 hypothetical protein NLL37_08145 [Corynebacterium pseudodiphtheriticum]